MKHLTDEDLELLESYCNETISDEDLEKLEERLLEDSDFRKEARTYFSMDSFMQMDQNSPVPLHLLEENEPFTQKPKPKSFFWPMAFAASLSFFAGILVLYSLNNTKKATVVYNDGDATKDSDMVASGFAVIDKAVNAEWEDNSKVYVNGQAVGQEKLRLKKGIVHLEFFCGASVILEGPAEFDVNSSWEGFCHKGKLRANVPPAAHGFRIDTPKNKIVDLGTEFGVNVGSEEESVVVFEGEIELHGQGKEMKLLQAGNAVKTTETSQQDIPAIDPENFIKTAGLNDLYKKNIQEKYSIWKSNSLKWASDPRLIAYYNFDHENTPFVRNNALKPKNNLDGKIIRAERVDGRWGQIESGGAMEFKKPGSRVRVNIPGEFQYFTFSAWVRIDSLDRDWNALFMGDSYQIGEPHWQIYKDGRLVLCVRKYDRPKDYHVLYYSPKIWDPAESGQWMHLATIYDPVKKEMKHFKNGELIYREAIQDYFNPGKLRIGPAEIGNWGLPTRTDPVFALRNINGRIDELMILDAALSNDEIKQIYESGKP
ncbi:MAG: FecR domain-containing protein [Lentisphaeraceae bacterium]|nr:FecR domain-containing protein [Lentisphaeraceae bacterium]